MTNYMILQGRMVSDPELRHVSGNLSVCSFRVAWSEKYGSAESKLFLTCNAWRGTAEAIAKYFSKGQEIIVEGPLVTREWKDRNGQNRTVVEMNLSHFQFCGPKAAAASAPVAANEVPWEDQGTVDDDDNLPF